MKLFKESKLMFLALLGMIILNSITISSYAKVQDTSTIKVEVILGNNNKDEIDKIQLDDGSYLGEYDYEIISKGQQTRITSELSQYFTTAYWIDRDGEISLSLQPLSGVRNSSSTKETAWTAILKPSNGIVTSEYWDNATCMKWQYDCHFNSAIYKQYWNLEPSRTASNYTQVVLNKCNP